MPARLTSTSIVPNAWRAAATACIGRFLAPDIGRDALDLRGRDRGADLRERGTHRLGVAVDQHDAGALLAEQQPGRGADAPCPAGDDRNPVGKPTRTRPSLFSMRDSVRMMSRAAISQPRKRMEIIDLSMPIGPHFRWSPELRIKGDIAAGDQFRISHLATTCHGFTHVDAQAHFVAHAPTIEATPLARVVGPARVIDLRDVAPNSEIDAAQAREPRSRRRGRRDPDPVRRVGHETRQHHAGILEGGALAQPRRRRMAAHAQAYRRRVRLPAGLSDPAAARRQDRAERPARDARRAAARRRDADRVSGQHAALRHRARSCARRRSKSRTPTARPHACSRSTDFDL